MGAYYGCHIRNWKGICNFVCPKRCKFDFDGRREDRLIRLKEELEENHSIEVQTNCFDVRNRAECKKCVDSIEQPIDILLNNAGLAAGKGKIDDADFDDWDAMIDKIGRASCREREEISGVARY